MAEIVLQLPDFLYRNLEKEAARAGKAIEGLLIDWILQIPETKENIDIKKDPLFNFHGFETAAPADLSINADKYLYEDPVN